MLGFGSPSFNDLRGCKRNATTLVQAAWLSTIYAATTDPNSSVAACEKHLKNSVCKQPGSPWENGVVESFNARLRNELLNRESFWNLLEARVVPEEYRQFYNAKRPHRSLGGLSPEAFANQSATHTSRLSTVKVKLTA